MTMFKKYKTAVFFILFLALSFLGFYGSGLREFMAANPGNETLGMYVPPLAMAIALISVYGIKEIWKGVKEMWPIIAIFFAVMSLWGSAIAYREYADSKQTHQQCFNETK